MSDGRKQKLAVVLFNLGGPDSLDAVRPFLHNLFSDPAIIGAPTFIRKILAQFISARRAPVAQDIYRQLGGKSPLLENTEDQAEALAEALSKKYESKCFIAMRYWHPMTEDSVAEVKRWGPDRVVLLPLYPQYSTTTSASSIKAWQIEALAQGLNVPARPVCCYPTDEGFISAILEKIQDCARENELSNTRILFSAHGLPKRVIEKGDPYQWQVEQTVAALVHGLAIEGLDWTICYQSRVGPLEWIGPATDDEIERAGADGKSVILCPVGFVAENSETVFELDIEYKELAESAGVISFHRVATVSSHESFISGLAGIVDAAAGRMSDEQMPLEGARRCPPEFSACPCRQSIS